MKSALFLVLFLLLETVQGEESLRVPVRDSLYKFFKKSGAEVVLKYVSYKVIFFCENVSLFDFELDKTSVDILSATENSLRLTVDPIQLALCQGVCIFLPIVSYDGKH